MRLRQQQLYLDYLIIALLRKRYFFLKRKRMWMWLQQQLWLWMLKSNIKKQEVLQLLQYPLLFCLSKNPSCTKYQRLFRFGASFFSSRFFISSTFCTVWHSLGTLRRFKHSSSISYTLLLSIISIFLALSSHK